MVKANLPTFLAAPTANHVKTHWKLTNQSSARELGKFPVYKRERGCRSHKAFLRNVNGNLFCIFQVLKFPPLYTFLYKLWITITRRDQQFLNKLACILFIYLQYSTGNSRFLQENSQEKKARNTTRSETRTGLWLSYGEGWMILPSQWRRHKRQLLSIKIISLIIT